MGRQLVCFWGLQDSIRISFGKGHKLATYTLAELLPQRFGPGDLLDITKSPLLLQPQENSFQLTEGTFLMYLPAGLQQIPSIQAYDCHKAATRTMAAITENMPCWP